VYRLSFLEAPRFQAVNIVRALLGMRYYVQLAAGAAASAVASIDSAVSHAGVSDVNRTRDMVADGGSSQDFVDQLDEEVQRNRRHNVCRYVVTDNFVLLAAACQVHWTGGPCSLLCVANCLHQL
jgi:hypothetical protein